MECVWVCTCVLSQFKVFSSLCHNSVNVVCIQYIAILYIMFHGNVRIYETSTKHGDHACCQFCVPFQNETVLMDFGLARG